jgi:hypothetical protein
MSLMSISIPIATAVIGLYFSDIESTSEFASIVINHIFAAVILGVGIGSSGFGIALFLSLQT